MHGQSSLFHGSFPISFLRVQRKSLAREKHSSLHTKTKSHKSHKKPINEPNYQETKIMSEIFPLKANQNQPPVTRIVKDTNLDMVGSLTDVPAWMLLFKQSAPSVSMARMGTEFHALCPRTPSITPIRRPPPPTDTTIQLGTVPDGRRLRSISDIMVACPFLNEQTFELPLLSEIIILLFGQKTFASLNS